MSHLRQQVLKYKREQDDVHRKERELEAKIRHIERDREIEKVIVKRMAIEKVKEQQSLLDDLLRKKENEVDAINRQNENIDYKSSLMLKKALERGEVLQKQIESGALDRRTQGLLVDSILNKNAESDLIRQQILEEVKAKMLRDKED